MAKNKAAPRCFRMGSWGTSGSAANGKAVQLLQRSFGEMQGILEQNRMLIQQIGQNHETDGLTRNVTLIRELNTNITRVVVLYASLSYSFSHSLTVAKNFPAPAAADADKGYSCA